MTKKKLEAVNRQRMKIRNNSNCLARFDKGEVFTLPSVAVPNESYTIKELYDKHVCGQALPPIGKPVGYPENASHNSFDYEELAKADLVDKMEAADYLKEVVVKGRNQQKKVDDENREKAAAAAAEEKAMRDAFKKLQTGAKKKVENKEGGANDDN